MPEFVLGGGEGGATLHSVEDLPLKDQAEYDQRSAELEEAMSLLMNTSVRMIVYKALDMRDELKETANDLAHMLATIPQTLALSLLGTFAGREASVYVDKLGGPEKLWEMFLNDQIPNCVCDNEDCENRRMPLDPEHGH